MIFGSRVKIKEIEFGKEDTEAECDNRSKVKFADVFDDYLNIIDSVENDVVFIISGRKGVGKSAIARHYINSPINNGQFFCTYINAVGLKFEAVLQHGHELGLGIDPVNLFRWSILISLGKSLLKNEGVKRLNEFSSLESFFKVNAGYTELGNNSFEEAIKKYKANIEVEGLFQFVKANISKLNEREVREKKANFVSVIPRLEETIKFLLNNEFSKGNKYRVVFDDLDVLFSPTEDGFRKLADLIRVARMFNIDFVHDNPDIDLKVIISMRNDQLSQVVKYSPDINKIVQSSAKKINWYIHNDYLQDELSTPIRKLCEKRIQNALTTLDKNKTMGTWWDEVFDSNEKDDTFKFFLDHTFYRPRDVIMLFNSIKTLYDRAIPIPKACIEGAVREYSKKIGTEICNELLMLFSNNDVDALIKSLRGFDDQISPSAFKLLLKENGINNVDFAVEQLFEYGIIGVRHSKGTFFSYWDVDLPASIHDESVSFIKHLGLRSFLKN
jgi:hypothetical protein